MNLLIVAYLMINSLSFFESDEYIAFVKRTRKTYGIGTVRFH
jgi:protein-tyrosine phosphatase